MRASFSAFCYLHLFILQNVVFAYEITFERFEMFPGPKQSLVSYLDWKFVRVKSHYVFNGGIWLHVDVDENFFRSIDFEYSMNGNKFVKHPYKIAKDTICNFYNTTYKNHLQNVFEGHSNFPKIPPEGLCPIPKGKYWVSNATINMVIPPGIPKGYWKATMNSYKQNEVVGGLRAYARLQ